ncbi:MAG: hypothetical protein M1825_000822 [Sarcosagium campestre]|nr:MAG: hypothetical protein M1825_000822 [Sarcosagium campestre]
MARSDADESRTISGEDAAADAAPDVSTLTLRDKRKLGERRGKGDGSLMLTKNDVYAVSQLPSLPERIRDQPADRLAGFMLHDSPYALALTATHALVWSYKVTLTIPETFTFTLPSSVKTGDPLPLGSLVPSPSASADPGLLVVMPLTGQITYWESITTAGALDTIRQRHHGISGFVGRIFSGETIVQLEIAEPAGFILSLSSGRVAHLSVKDGQGKPSISVQFMKSSAKSSGGLFGGLSNIFGGGVWRRDVAAVRAQRSPKARKTRVAVLTVKGGLQIWDVQRGGNHDLRIEVDAGEQMLEGIRSVFPEADEDRRTDFTVFDFQFATENTQSENADESSSADDDRGFNLLVLGALTGPQSSTYFIFELTVNHSSVVINHVHRLTWYTEVFRPHTSRSPRLMLPQPGWTAFVVFERAIVIVSLLQKPIDGPSKQLMTEESFTVEGFEDVIELRQDLGTEIVGCGIEDGFDYDGPQRDEGHSQRRKTRHPACILLVKQAGVLRIKLQSPKENINSITSSRISAKSKIEQAIYYGTQSSNVIDFAIRPNMVFSEDEVETAVKDISNDVLASNSATIVTSSPSVEHQLKERANSLKALAVYVKRMFRPLSRATKWKLLEGAEKMAAARSVWRLYDARVLEKGPKDDEPFLKMIIDMLGPKLKHKREPEKGELDSVRHYLVHDIAKIEAILPWTYHSLQELYKEGKKSHEKVAHFLVQGTDIALAILETAFEFRQEHASHYGLEGEDLSGGILNGNYAGIPPLWTSIAYTTWTYEELTRVTRELVADSWPNPSLGGPSPEDIGKLRDAFPRLIDGGCKAYIENHRWCIASDDERVRNRGRDAWNKYLEFRHQNLAKIAELGLVEEGIDLAERYQDMPTLVELVVDGTDALEARAKDSNLPDDQAASVRANYRAFKARFEEYFNLHGDRWADALFKYLIAEGQLGRLLSYSAEWQGYLTRFLRCNPAYGKIGWINEVLGEKDLASASQALLDQGRVKEKDLWSKKVEISLGRLASLASQGSESNTDAEKEPKQALQVKSQLELIAIQEKLYHHIGRELYAAIDEHAEIDLAMQEFGKKVTKEKPALGNVFEEAMTAVVARESLGAARLIHVLTLMDHHYDLEHPSAVAGQEFNMALEALKAGEIESQQSRAMLERIIWRRCMIRDDWTVINDTQLKDDRAVEQSTGDTALFATLKAVFKTGPKAASSQPRPLGPLDVLGAGTTAKELEDSFPEDVRGAIAMDMKKEDEQLQHYINKGRLNDWFAGVRDAAKRSVLDDIEAEAAVAEMKIEQRVRLWKQRKSQGEESDVEWMDSDDDADVEMG